MSFKYWINGRNSKSWSWKSQSFDRNPTVDPEAPIADRLTTDAKRKESNESIRKYAARLSEEESRNNLEKMNTKRLNEENTSLQMKVKTLLEEKDALTNTCKSLTEKNEILEQSFAEIKQNADLKFESYKNEIENEKKSKKRKLESQPKIMKLLKSCSKCLDIFHYNFFFFDDIHFFFQPHYTILGHWRFGNFKYSKFCP